MNRDDFTSRFFAKLGLALVLVGMIAPLLVAQTPTNFKVAFIADQGSGSNARAVLNLIKSEGANAVVHSGDFDYGSNPSGWDGLITQILGANFPYFASIGNHDTGKFFGSGGYQSYMSARMNRLGITWDGDLGVKSSFKFNGIFFLLTGPGVSGSGHDVYIRDKLAADNSIWSISSWHKNMKLMQVGGKGDETGWGVYEEARKGGAIIATGHEHSYSRTHLLSSCQNQTVAGTSNTLVLAADQTGTAADEGRSFVFVSGLGGKSVRSQSLSGAWWAAIYTSTQGATYGALFGVFNFNGEANKAHFYFKAINGFIADDFYVISNVTPPAPPTISSFSPTGGPVGTEVTIIGANLLTTSQVAFNGSAGTNLKIDSDSQIRATVPSAATSGTISVTTAGGTATSADIFTVAPAPTIATFAPTKAQVGAEITITGNNFSSATQVAFNGVAASNPIIVSNNEIRAIVPTGATTGKISVTNPDGTGFSATNFTIQYLLTVATNGSGSVTLNPSGNVYDAGTVVQLTANPGIGYQFSGWSGDLTGTTSPANITMNADKNVTATFAAAPPVQLTVTIVGPGSVTLDPSGGAYPFGTVVRLEAIPNSGHQFSGWSGDLTGATNPTTITMNANKNVTATFIVISPDVVYQETKTGGSTSSKTVSTSASLTAANGNLYLATVSSKPKVSVTAVSGLGLTWTLVKAQCAGRNQTGVEIWKAQGTPSSSGTVSATLASVPNNAVIVVSRYSGVNATNPIGNVVSANTLGVNGVCSGGVDNNTYSFNLTTTVNGAVIFGAAALRNKAHTPGAGYTERAEFVQGGSSGGSAAGVAVEDKTVASASTATVNGTFASAVDWAVVAVEIKPQSGLSKRDALSEETTVASSSPPSEYQLEQNHPNPFNPTTVISFQLPVNSEVTLSIFNTNGQLVKQLITGEINAGQHTLVWDATNDRGERVASGVYLYVLQAGAFTAQRKLVLMK